MNERKREEKLRFAPWEHQNERMPLTRTMCLTLNSMTKAICEL